MAKAEDNSRGRRPFALILLIGCLYAIGYCLWYSGTPMGSHPVLDGKENLQLAWDIADGVLPSEPFYRAPMYPLIISLGMGLGLSESLWPDFCRLVNLSAWLVSLWLVARLALQLWGDQRASITASAVWALYPVGLFFLGDPLDITLSIALLLGGLDRASAFLRTASPQSALSSGFLLALAALTRPQMWTVALAVPLILIVLVYVFGRRGRVEVVPKPDETPLKPPPRWPVFFIFVGLAVPAVMMGAFNQKLSGEFVIMPTQGPFNLWAANRPGAHGKYFAQQIEIYQNDEHENPAYVESVYHFVQDNGADATLNWRTLNEYWRGRTRAMIAEDPSGFLGRILRKAYYLFNDYEQYNNKTYAVHKELSPWLKFNPLGWGLLLLAATPLVFIGRKNPLLLTLLLGTVAAYAGGLILTYVSARFRLPMAPLLAVVAAGWVTLPWRYSSTKQKIAGSVMAVVALGLAYSTLLKVREPATAIQDYLLLGYAALDAGQDTEAAQWAEKALEENPDRLAARELSVVSTYNLVLAKVVIEGEERPSAEALVKLLRSADSLASYSPRVAYIAGVYEWWSCQAEAARSRWLAQVDQPNSVSQSALTALLMTGDLPLLASAALQRVPEKERQATLQVALARAQGKPLNEAGQALMEQLMAVYGAPKSK